ncbi:hypothetical protein [Priestia aryabhattai]|uniref:hypothetical protein n=1 Tax=Priestia aryabhattai TaxID=412384 RepID=UPI00089097F1|nr:hypothetical protein SAMN04487777_111132 [Priestia aryabhattai B8W22]
MSLVTYLATNFTLPFTEDGDKKILVGECFSDIEDRQKVRKHFSNKYVYEIFTDEGGGFWFNDDFKEEYLDDNLKSQEDFLELCKFLDTYLEKDTYCEVYVCWIGEEEEERNKECDQVINLNNLDIEKVQIHEKTLLIIRK